MGKASSHCCLCACRYCLGSACPPSSLVPFARSALLHVQAHSHPRPPYLMARCICRVSRSACSIRRCKGVRVLVSLRSRPPRSRSGAPCVRYAPARRAYALRLKKVVCIVLCLFYYSVGALGSLPLGSRSFAFGLLLTPVRRAPFGVLGSLSLAVGAGGLPLSKTGVSRASKTPVKN